jgi:hypothetical protein
MSLATRISPALRILCGSRAWRLASLVIVAPSITVELAEGLGLVVDEVLEPQPVTRAANSTVTVSATPTINQAERRRPWFGARRLECRPPRTTPVKNGNLTSTHLLSAPASAGRGQ